MTFAHSARCGAMMCPIIPFSSVHPWWKMRTLTPVPRHTKIGYLNSFMQSRSMGRFATFVIFHSATMHSMTHSSQVPHYVITRISSLELHMVSFTMMSGITGQKGNFHSNGSVKFSSPSGSTAYPSKDTRPT